MAHYGPTNPPEDQGFLCYCPECEKLWHTDCADPETGLIYCGCGAEFQPEE